MTESTSKVVGLFGVSPAEPVPFIVDELEKLLARAKSGELRSFAYVTSIDRNNMTECDYFCEPGGRFAIGAGIVELMHRFGRDMIGDKN